MAKLGKFFGPHSGEMRIFLGFFSIGSGKFGTLSDSACKFAGSYNAMGQSGAFTIAVTLTDQNPASASGPCTVTLNGKTDGAAKYQINGEKLTINTALNDAPLNIYPSQSGTQIDNISDHNIWIGP